MLILPAIDLLDGRCVRLRRGRFDRAVVYSDDPLAVAQSFVAQGAEALHVVDLDGARLGRPRNLEWVYRIRAAVPVPIQLGGGVRTSALAARLYKVGIDRIVLGTVAAEGPALLRKLLDRYGPDRVAAALDLRDGRLAIEGWTSESSRAVAPVIGDLEAQGVRWVVCTDVNRDGVLAGPDLELASRIGTAGFRVIVAGGVTTVDDIARVREAGAAGCVIGSALYTGKLTLREAIEAAHAD